MADPTVRTVSNGKVDLFVREWGAAGPDRPTVMLVHGYPDNSSLWEPVAQRLAERYHVVAHDVRGAGRSTAPRRTRDYRFDHLVADIVAVADAVSPDRPVHLVGHDWGSIQGWDAVTRDELASRFASFTSISGPRLDHVAAEAAEGLRTPRRWPALARQLVRSQYIVFFHVPVLPALAWRTGVAAAVLRRLEGIEASPADGRRGTRLYRANFFDRMLRPRAGPTNVPVQVVVPTDDRYVRPVLTTGLERWTDRLWRREIAGPHWVPRTHPDVVSRLIGELVDHVEGGPEPAGLLRSRLSGSRRARDGWLVVVTGAGSGIGRATALAFAEQGATIVAADIDGATAARTAELARLVGAPSARAYTVDVGDADAMERFAKEVDAELGVPDVVVNNAGIGIAGGMLATSVDDWERTLRVNLWGVIHGSRLFAAQMAARGEGGHIVNVASAAAFVPSRTLPAYSTSKAAVLMLSQCLRAEVGGLGIGVSAICPGLINTGITTATRHVGVSEEEQERRRRATSGLYRRRAFAPERVAAAVLDAVDRNLAVVPVAPEAKALELLGRLAPGLARRVARMELTR